MVKLIIFNCDFTKIKTKRMGHKYRLSGLRDHLVKAPSILKCEISGLKWKISGFLLSSQK